MYLDHVTLAVSDLTADARRLGDALGLMVNNGSIRLGHSQIDLKALEQRCSCSNRASRWAPVSHSSSSPEAPASARS
jgi:hypothetical protein